MANFIRRLFGIIRSALKQIPMEKPNVDDQSINSHISNYLTEYFEQRKPQYAVMLKGTWGCGKTWYINNFLIGYRKLPKAKKVVHISLFGLTKLSAIDDAIFYAFNPNLDNPIVRGSQKVLRGLSAKYKLDIDNDNDNDGSLSFNFSEMFNRAEPKMFDDLILVLDDLERCEIEENTLFGYINKFLEHGNHKVVLIGHEVKIMDKVTSDSQLYKYKDIKEKLIGQTFEVKGSLEALVNHQIQSCLANIKSTAEKNAIIETIILVNKDGGNKNLRVIKQNITAFRNFYAEMPDRLKKIDELLRATVYHYFRIGYEFKVGNQTIEDLGKTGFDSFIPTELIEKVNTIVKRKNEGDDKRYTESFKYHCPISNPMWQKYFDIAVLNRTEIEACLDRSKYFEFDAKPPWHKLWRASYFNQDKIDEWVKQSLDALSDKSLSVYMEVVEIMVVLLEMDKSEVVGDDILDMNKAFQLANDEVVRISKITTTDAHLRIWDEINRPITKEIANDSRIKDLHSRIIELGTVKQEGSFEDNCKGLLDLLDNNSSASLKEFEDLLRSSNWHTATYAYLPVLSKMNPKTLLHALLKVDSHIYWTAQHALINRYKRDIDLYKIMDESSFIEEFKKEVDDFVKKSPRSINKYKMISMSSGLAEHVLPKLKNVNVPSRS